MTEPNHLVTESTLQPVKTAEWATPIVAVLKPSKTNVCIYRDFKQIIMPVSTLDKYIVPEVEDLFSVLTAGKFFSN